MHFSLFYCTFYFLFLFLPIYIYSCVVLLLYNLIVILFFILFFSLHCPLSGPDLTYISLLIIPCIIYHVTNKETLNLEPWTATYSFYKLQCWFIEVQVCTTVDCALTLFGMIFNILAVILHLHHFGITIIMSIYLVKGIYIYNIFRLLTCTISKSSGNIQNAGIFSSKILSSS